MGYGDYQQGRWDAGAGGPGVGDPNSWDYQQGRRDAEALRARADAQRQHAHDMQMAAALPRYQGGYGHTAQGYDGGTGIVPKLILFLFLLVTGLLAVVLVGALIWFVVKRWGFAPIAWCLIIPQAGACALLAPRLIQLSSVTLPADQLMILAAAGGLVLIVLAMVSRLLRLPILLGLLAGAVTVVWLTYQAHGLNQSGALRIGAASEVRLPSAFGAEPLWIATGLVCLFLLGTGSRLLALTRRRRPAARAAGSGQS